MRYLELFENQEHQDALDSTGFWGKQAAGCIIVSNRTKRVLLPFRSLGVEQPHTWGTWGGAIDESESPEAAVRREVAEETGYSGSIGMVPLYVFRKGTFAYHNFLAIVEDEFQPTLDWETESARWFEFGKWPSPLHFGLAGIFQDRPSLDKIKHACNWSG